MCHRAGLKLSMQAGIPVRGLAEHLQGMPLDFGPLGLMSCSVLPAAVRKHLNSVPTASFLTSERLQSAERGFYSEGA